jgi:proteic killer suppression protein
MIVRFRDEWLRAFFVEDARSRQIPSDLESRLFRKLQMIDDATTDQDLRVPPSNHFEKLRGNLAGFRSIRVNNQWRLVFRWDGSRGEQRVSISTTTVTDEANHADNEAQAGHGRRDSDRGVHAADGVDAGCPIRGDGRSAQARQ